MKTKTKTLDKIELEELGIPRSKHKIDDIGTPLTVNELGLVLKKMKPNKTPGMDGFTAEFFKVFWRQLKYHIVNAINCSFVKGNLSETLRQCVITCLPKSNKDRSLIKNWRPISLLSVIYKLASGAIADSME